ncbi:hypothetical protein CR513_28557, partial [Mucuna pruriens]
MINLEAQFILEKASLTRPPTFTRKDYPYLRDRMEMYIKSTQYNIWEIITCGDKVVNKPKTKYTQDVRYIITCVLSKIEYNKFCCYKKKDMCDATQITFEDTEDV